MFWNTYAHPWKRCINKNKVYFPRPDFRPSHLEAKRESATCAAQQPCLFPTDIWIAQACDNGHHHFFQSIWRQTRKQYRKRYYCCLETRSPTLHYPPPRTGTPTSSSIVLSNHSFERFARKDGNRQSQPSNDSSALTIETSNFRRRRARPTRMRRREFSDGTRSVPWNGSKRGSDNRRPSNSNTTAIGHCCRLISVYIVMGRVWACHVAVCTLRFYVEGTLNVA